MAWTTTAGAATTISAVFSTGMPATASRTAAVGSMIWVGIGDNAVADSDATVDADGVPVACGKTYRTFVGVDASCRNAVAISGDAYDTMRPSSAPRRNTIASYARW